MKVSEILRKAAENTRGNWYQGEYEDPSDNTKHCVLGQIGLACGLKTDDYFFGFENDTPEEIAVKLLDEVIQEQYPNFGVDYANGSVYMWNDTPGRTEEEVITVLEKAAVRAEEME